MTITTRLPTILSRADLGNAEIWLIGSFVPTSDFFSWECLPGRSRVLQLNGHDMMIPAQVEVIATGQFVDDQDKINVKPITFVKGTPKIVAKSLTL
ncbi:MAG: hypothetical protein ABFS56_17290 [Pseudomonadota bacterium]